MLYFRQTYEENAAANPGRVPDFRSQLLWMPSLHLEEQEITILFYTWDVTGIFEISIEGFTKEGEPCSIREYIRVE